ncbi:hypothetical protein OG978_43090 (plasmid) [Streptomyces sp. NBC_01591]|uniref:hypothetical protein n=1 Tax=Streptomyces sp. NBC_01591 TaxID=2975888 RepID=UPI002DDB0D27|nr:hypothetical protein [Streptomyces sp. NBC_01591]WSD73968.1 hypothetical protein OG978_43090 [Streptomyces sp. NBC_01591]
MALTHHPTPTPTPATAPAPPSRRNGPPHTPLPGPLPLLTATLLTTALITTAALAGGPLRSWLDAMAGVVALVALSGSVLLGLTTVFRDLLAPHHRRYAQHLHRAAGLLGIGFLVLHITVKIAGHRIGPGDALLTRGLPTTAADFWLALGTLACYLFLLAAATGVWRGAFATRRWIRPFRVLHGASYAGWGAAVVHGLTAGRTPAPWVVASYAVCLAAAVAAQVQRRRRVLAQRRAQGQSPQKVPK